MLTNIIPNAIMLSVVITNDILQNVIMHRVTTMIVIRQIVIILNVAAPTFV
jgi:hypothetical protein